MAERNFLLILMYHQLFTDRPVDSYSVAVSSFERHMRRLAAEGFESVLPGRPGLSGAGKKVMITFDDGYASDYRYALPIVRRYGFSGVSFITTSYVDTPGYLQRDEVMHLQRGGFAIQAHTHTHPLLERCTPERLAYELAYPKQLLESWLKTKVTCVSLPGGSCPASIGAAAVASGYEYVFSSIPRLNFPPVEPGSVLGRVCIGSHCSENDFARIAGGEPGVFFRAAAGSAVRGVIKRIIGGQAYHYLWRMLCASPNERNGGR